MSKEEVSILIKQNTRHLLIMIALIFIVGVVFAYGYRNNRSDIDMLEQRVMGRGRP